MKHKLFLLLPLLSFLTILKVKGQKLYFDDLLYCVQNSQEKVEGYLYTKHFIKGTSKYEGNPFVNYLFGGNMEKGTSISILSKLTVKPGDKEALFNYVEYATTYKSVFNIIKNEAIANGFKYDGKVKVFEIMADVYRLKKQAVGLYINTSVPDTSYTIFFTEQTE